MLATLNDEFRIVKEQAREIVGGEAECAGVDDLASLKVAIQKLEFKSLNLTDSELVEVVDLLSNIENPYG